MQFNIRSIYHKLQTLIYDFVKESIDIIGFCETWLSCSVPDNLVSIPGYRVVRNDREYGRGGGTCFYVKNGLEYVCNMVSVPTRDVEIQNITLTGIRDNQQHLKEIELVLVYRPPKGNDFNGKLAIAEFVNAIKNLDKKELVIMGDFNWNL